MIKKQIRYLAELFSSSFIMYNMYFLPFRAVFLKFCGIKFFQDQFELMFHIFIIENTFHQSQNLFLSVDLHFKLINISHSFVTAVVLTLSGQAECRWTTREDSRISNGESESQSVSHSGKETFFKTKMNLVGEGNIGCFIGPLQGSYFNYDHKNLAFKNHLFYTQCRIPVVQVYPSNILQPSVFLLFTYWRGVTLIAGQKFELPIGEHIYPFSVTLPNALPSTYKGTYGGVTYCGKVEMDLPWALNKTETRDFIVESLLNLNYLPELNVCVITSVSPKKLQKIMTHLILLYLKFQRVHRDEKSKTFCCWCCASGPLTVAVHIPRTAYVFNEPIPLIIEVDNASNVKVNSVINKLIQV